MASVIGGFRYQPTLRVTTRTKEEGGDMCAAQETWRSGQALQQRELLVLCHGYNNPVHNAEEAYTGFRVGQERYLPGDDVDRFEQMIGDFYWMGDVKWWGPLNWLNFAYYPKAVGNAKDTAPKLADYLARRSAAGLLWVHFVAHSLGCRLVLETIRELQRRGAGPRIGKVCLMAAAVPTFMVFDGGALHDALRVPERLRALFSPADLVLQFAFPPGQTAALGDEGRMPTAIGRHGDLPVGGPIDREHIEGADHGDYWAKSDKAACARAVLAISGFLQVGPGLRTLRSEPSPPAREAASVRESAGQRDVGTPVWRSRFG